MKRFVTFVSILLCCALPAFGQQTGSISGKVTSPDGDALPGVAVEARGDVLPRPRTTTTEADGDYRFQLLPPGNYVLTFTLSGLETATREVKVLLQQDTTVNVAMRPEGVTEELVVYGESAPIDATSAEIKTAVSDEVISSLPVGQEYRDLVKLIPGVQYTEDATRGPSAGGSGQDNVYQFDGVNVGLPLFGTLSAEPSSHDVEQIAIVKGGAKAIDFNRSGGFTINSISKSGTNRFLGDVSFQLQTDDMTGDRDTGSSSEFEEDKDWIVANIGGPILEDSLFFYASYYRPTVGRASRSNLYGEVPDFDSTRDELFGKLSFSPSDSLLLHLSHRNSDREDSGLGVAAEDEAGSTSEGGDTTLEISILEGSWIVSDRSFVTFKYTDFLNENSSRPDDLLGFPIFVDGSLGLDVAGLDRQGLLLVPQPIAGQDAYNAFIASIVDRFGFLENGVRTGGGEVGVGSTINDQNFGRESFQVAYETTIGDHQLHFGYQWYVDEEDLSRTSNGWGVISVPGGRTATADGTPIFYEARFEQQSLLDASGEVIPPIHSELESQSIEVNDTWALKDWTINFGVVLSNDELYGQGLRENSANESGFELAPGNQYKMYEVDFGDMIQPRLGLVRSFGEGRSTAYANWARYHPAASSLPRAASWARNLRQSIRAFFDADGNLISSEPVLSSSGKFFQPDLDPRAIDEYLIGYSRQISSRWTAKAHARYRYGYNFWEDTNNNARLAFEPPEGVPQEDYIPELGSYRAEVGGSSYVIAELDNAFTKYYEASFDAQWRGQKAHFQGSYVWSHYYGNFDQDNTTAENDDNIFIGSSFIADGAGRQLWDFRYGDLRGDRRHQLKAYGYYNFDWNGSVGVFAVYQSGQPWEAWNVEVYRHLTSSTSDTSRFAEPAGSRTTSDHYQVDLNYTQSFRFGGRYNVQLRADLYNVFDKQTGYNVQSRVNSAGFGDPRSFFDPRRLQLMVRFQF
ncbi:MAG TPA: carboxypeptidase regulatory-like domain-containing protein [Thermoanaerobaculia bacterium]